MHDTFLSYIFEKHGLDCLPAFFLAPGANATVEFMDSHKLCSVEIIWLLVTTVFEH